MKEIHSKSKRFFAPTVAAGFLLALVFTFNACSNGDEHDESDNNSGSCDINDYKIVKIGEQTWMAENLNCDVSNSKCYDNKSANCNKYGRLYDWWTAITVCPLGWRLPSNDDWEQLINYIENDKGCTRCTAKYLKAKSGWQKDGNGQDAYGFSALPSGHSYSHNNLNNNFSSAGIEGYWWNSNENEDDDYQAYYQVMFYDEMRSYYFGNLTNFYKYFLFSVRCLKD
jgi:uncharacterized protein (TIGR02145 family)